MSDLPIHYNLSLIVISVVIAIGASYAALSMSERVRAATSRKARRLWLLSGAAAMGLGIWSMHYLGMLAVELSVPVFYYWPTVLVSLVLAIVAARAALGTVSQETLHLPRLLAGGLLMAAGIGGMHYVGMAAMRSSAMEHYNPAVVVFSVLIAAIFSWAALWIAITSRRNRDHATGMRLFASLAMGLGISAMHYIAMAGVHFTRSDMPFSTRGAVKVDLLGESVIATITITVLISALVMSMLDKRRFDDLQRVHTDLMAAQTALLEVQVQLREANAMLSELAVRDSLTGLYNRRHFDAALQTELRRAARNNSPISLLILDVDLFKLLNDGYGHQRGDDCLRRLARVLEDRPSRGYDVVARYGGEEFVILLPDADALATLEIAESIRQAVHALQIENRASTVAPFVTISAGVCCQDAYSGYNAEALVHRADQALYAAKSAGRNRIQLAAPASAPTLAAV